MCLSATANFVGGAIVSGVGVATLAQVERPRELVLASLPLSFGVHQILEGFVWLGLQGRAPFGIGDEAATAYLYYAQALLPVLGPLAVLPIAPPRRRRLLIAFLLAGIALAAYIAWTLVTSDPGVRIAGNSLDYRNPALGGIAAVIAYVVVTLGPFLASGHRWLIGFGALNVVGLSAVFAVEAFAFTSIWCAYAAAVSVVLYGYFRGRRRAPSDERLGASAAAS